jgi:endonuclease/exonuclease/phosphatase family metal-dependent hydrolase
MSHPPRLRRTSTRLAGPALACLAALVACCGNGVRTSSDDAPRDEFVAATLNIWHDQENWRARLGLMRDSLEALEPDVIFLQEVIQRDTVPNQATMLAESLGCRAFFASVDPPGAPKRYGNAILTRHAIVATHEVKLEPLDDYRVAAHARLDVAGRTVDVYVTHLHHTPEGSAIRAQQVRHLLAFIDETCSKGAIVLGGDFNAAPDAPELRPIRDRLTDAYAAVHLEPVGVPVTTLNPAKGHAPRRIDYIFAAAGPLRPVDAAVFLDRPTAAGIWASDHFGVWVRLRWVK